LAFIIRKHHDAWYSERQIHIYTLLTVGCLLADANRTRMTDTYCVYIMLRYSWWWTVDMSETCRVLYQI